MLNLSDVCPLVLLGQPHSLELMASHGGNNIMLEAMANTMEKKILNAKNYRHLLKYTLNPKLIVWFKPAGGSIAGRRILHAELM